MGWVREHKPLITEVYGQPVLGLFIFLNKAEGVRDDLLFKNKKSSILSMLATVTACSVR